MATVAVIFDTKDVNSRLAKGSAFLSGNDALSQECLGVMGQMGLKLERDSFLEHSKPSNEFWPRLGVATVILRKGGVKLLSDADVEAKRAGTPKLRDHQFLLDSLTVGGANNVFELEKNGVAVGTADRRAAVLHNGGETDPFVFDEEKRRIFAENVPALVHGAPDKEMYAEATGEYSDKRTHRMEWKKHGLPSPWNPLHFLWKGILRKWAREGRRGRVPARPIIVPPDEAGRKKLVSILRDYVRRAFGGNP
jgi:hypothetical protein